MSDWREDIGPQPPMRDQTSKDLMVDIETLGTKPGCVVLSAVGVWFDREGNGKTSVAFNHSYNIERQIADGRFIDPETARWWFEQPISAFLEMANRRKLTEGNMAHASLEINNALEGANRIWSCGPDFDPPILNALFPGIKWPFWKNRDVRTMRDMLSMEDRNRINTRWLNTQHNPEADCRRQIDEVVMAWKGAKIGIMPLSTGNST